MWRNVLESCGGCDVVRGAAHRRVPERQAGRVSRQLSNCGHHAFGGASAELQILRCPDPMAPVSAEHKFNIPCAACEARTSNGAAAMGCLSVTTSLRPSPACLTQRPPLSIPLSYHIDLSHSLALEGATAPAAQLPRRKPPSVCHLLEQVLVDPVPEELPFQCHTQPEGSFSQSNVDLHVVFYFKCN